MTDVKVCDGLAWRFEDKIFAETSDVRSFIRKRRQRMKAQVATAQTAQKTASVPWSSLM
jgi:hypothetical protein